MTDPWVITIAVVLAAVVASLRWLRVAQREHYLPGSATRFAVRWWTTSLVNRALLSVALFGAVAVWWSPAWGWLALAAAIGPVGLGLRGRTSPLAWTARSRRLAVGVVAVLVASAVKPQFAVAALVGLPLIVDLVLRILDPIERSLGQKWVAQAARRLASSGARVVAITGSYGKTTTKGYIGHLLSGRRQVVVSPASFNNRMGLARAINEHLAPGTEVFVAEMGTYGPGEIAELTSFVPPAVSVITAIGPVHLERFGSEDGIIAAKREILVKAETAILNVDHPGLAKVAEEEAQLRKVIRISATSREADVAVVDDGIWTGGTRVGEAPSGAFAINLAAALAVGIELGVSIEDMSRHLSNLPPTKHRRELTTADRGFVIIDDTYNSNPAGAAAALDLLGQVSGDGRRVVVTPGMVELGDVQAEENARFAKLVAETATDLVIVGATNRKALMQGSQGGSAAVSVVASRTEAVNWVRANLGPGDAVLYENDLPDHYP